MGRCHFHLNISPPPAVEASEVRFPGLVEDGFSPNNDLVLVSQSRCRFQCSQSFCKSFESFPVTTFHLNESLPVVIHTPDILLSSYMFELALYLHTNRQKLVILVLPPPTKKPLEAVFPVTAIPFRLSTDHCVVLLKTFCCPVGRSKTFQKLINQYLRWWSRPKGLDETPFCSLMLYVALL